MSGLAGELREMATAVELLERRLRDAADRAVRAEQKLAAAENVCELIADVRRGILTLDELYERTLTT